jgi:hypothetical protein
MISDLWVNINLELSSFFVSRTNFGHPIPALGATLNGQNGGVAGHPHWPKWGGQATPYLSFFSSLFF